MLYYVQRHLYLGDVQTIRQPATIYDAGIRAVLRLDNDLRQTWLDDFEVLHLPATANFTPAHLSQATAFIQQKLASGVAVLIQGYSTDEDCVALAMAYLMEYEGLSFGDAFLRTVRHFKQAFPPPHLLRLMIDHYQLPYRPDMSRFLFLLHLLEENESVRRFDHVQSGVYLGSVAALRQMEAVRAAGIGAVVRLDRVSRSEGQWEDDFALLDMPIPDLTSLNPERLAEATTFIHEQVSAGKQVLVHCQMGISRSTSIVMGYLIRYQGMSLAQAYQTVHSARPIAYPARGLLQSLIEQYQLPYDPQAVWKPNFLDQLLEDTR